jgi:hypothetical protein
VRLRRKWDRDVEFDRNVRIAILERRETASSIAMKPRFLEHAPSKQMLHGLQSKRSMKANAAWKIAVCLGYNDRHSFMMHRSTSI